MIVWDGGTYRIQSPCWCTLFATINPRLHFLFSMKCTLFGLIHALSHSRVGEGCMMCVMWSLTVLSPTIVFLCCVTNRFEQVPLVTPNGDVLVRNLNFEVSDPYTSHAVRLHYVPLLCKQD